jgi:hypothetical protein
LGEPPVVIMTLNLFDACSLLTFEILAYIFLEWAVILKNLVVPGFFIGAHGKESE